jgi:hypothetical protein
MATDHDAALTSNLPPGVTGTIADVPDGELLRRAVLSARAANRLCVTVPRWRAVMHVFGLGSTYADQLCRRFNLDPDEMVTR